MRCMYYRNRRRSCKRPPVSRNTRPQPAAPTASNSFYGLDTKYDPGGGMVPINHNMNMRQNRDAASPQACPNLQTQGPPISPEEAVENGGLYPPMFVPGVHRTYR